MARRRLHQRHRIGVRAVVGVRRHRGMVFVAGLGRVRGPACCSVLVVGVERPPRSGTPPAGWPGAANDCWKSTVPGKVIMFPVDIVVATPSNVAAAGTLSSSAARQPRRASQRIGRMFAQLLPALMAVVALQTNAAPLASPVPTKSNGKEPVVATFAGEYVGDAPVYHLPSISVVTTRKAALARLESEEQAAHARQARAKTGSGNAVLASGKADLAQNEASRCAAHARDHAKANPANGRGRQCS